MEDDQDLLRIFKREILSFATTLKNEAWIGKEREIISRFVFSNLLRVIQPNTAFYSSSQIGIEVRVKQTYQTDESKNEVCKDLVIWKTEYKTVFSDPYESPLLIVEWKYGIEYISNYDVEWLTNYIKIHPDTLEIAISINSDYRVNAALIEASKNDLKWIVNNT